MRRVVVVIFILTISCVMSLSYILFFSIFRTESSVSINKLLKNNNLTFYNLPDKLRELMERYPVVSDKIYDNWGFSFQASNYIRNQNNKLKLKARNLNQAIRLISENNYTSAKKMLDNYYYQYPNYVSTFSTNESANFPFPNNDDELSFYAVYQYHKGITLLELATLYSENEREKNEFLRMALYDLRRSAGSVEKLGKKGYWGNSEAWENVSFDVNNGEMPVYNIYAALSTAYLRIKNSKGYPTRDINYLKKMDKKYSLGATGISSITKKFINICITTKKDPLVRYRLTQALHNLETSSRCITKQNDLKINYLIGIILTHLGRLSNDELKAKAFSSAISYFQRVLDNNGDETIKDASRRALVLIYIEMQHDTYALEILKDMDPLKTEESILGTDRKYGLLFADLTQYGNFIRGNLDRIYDYENSRLTSINNSTIKKYHNELMKILSQNFYYSLSKRCNSLKQSEIPKFGSALMSWSKTEKYEDINWLSNPMSKIEASLRLKINYYIHCHSEIKIIIWLLPFILIGLISYYLIWVYREHKKIAKQVLESGYQKDLLE